MPKRRSEATRSKSRPGWSEAHVRRLFWRAGFGATAREVHLWARRSKKAALDHLLDPSPAQLEGPRPRVGRRPLDPLNEFNDDKLWWLDRMVRSTRPLEEKMTLFWHDHFATRNQPTNLMLDQNRLMRRKGLGSFGTLLREVTYDPALARFLSLTENVAEAPNENFARELMELFTLGSGYTETDIREASRALTGIRERRNAREQVTGVYFDPGYHDKGRKTIFGHTGNWGPDDVLRLCVAHPAHAPFLVAKLWDFLIGGAIPAGARDALAAQYVRSGLQLRPLVRSILARPELYRHLDRDDMVKWPAVLVAGQLRTMGAGVTIPDWPWLMASMGQSLFSPPSVAGWDWGTRWMSSNAMRARFGVANAIVRDGGPAAVHNGQVRRELKPDQHLAMAIRAVGSPRITATTRRELRRLIASYGRHPGLWERNQLQRSLRHLLISGPDNQVC
jgi:uncharacterized protein (DUF1800 family)